MSITSVNFGFLAEHDPVLVAYAADAEAVVHSHPRLSIGALRSLAEALAKHAAAYSGIYPNERDNLSQLLGNLRDRGTIDGQVGQLFRTLREAGNEASHAGTPAQPARTFTVSEAVKLLRMGRELAVWFHRAFKDPAFKPGPFVVPNADRPKAAVVSPVTAAALPPEILAESSESSKLGDAKVAAANADAEAAWLLAQENNAKYLALKAAFDAHLATTQAAAKASLPEAVSAVLQSAKAASQAVELNEAETRVLIDAQLRAAGWTVDSQTLRYNKGSRPVKGENRAIAEWPTGSGPADYALFAGLTLLGVVEAKKQATGISSTLDQALRYATSIAATNEMASAGGPWTHGAKVPFIFATNGRPYLKQLETQSGIWFQDLRRATNPRQALDGWKTPQGLLESLKVNVDDAQAALSKEPTDYLGLRDYQIRAIHAIEQGIQEGERNLLVAMATGTGKTRTCVGLIYRLVKTNRFRRVLFLVDRKTLGEQASDAFADAKLENFQSFAEIYGVKALVDQEPEATTRLQFATIQSMVRRLMDADSGGKPLPVDDFDCIVVDESHRGYTLDREMSETELTFRSQADYISKYRRVLEHFDAVKIGLTATPALHTVEIFGDPIYVYSYREAVIDGFLVDHEPAYVLVTQQSRDGIHFAASTPVPTYDTKTKQISLFKLPDDVKFEVEEFNRKVITKGFNQTVVAELVKEIDPTQPGKTLIFAVDNDHADMIVDLLRQAYRADLGPAFTDDLVAKITATVDNPLQKIRQFRNDASPNIVVTVDLLTTGVDIPKIVNLVFLRRVRSRILYDQMRGRATRLCPEIDKDAFRIYDAVNIVQHLEEMTDMKPVVVNPSIQFTQLVAELSTVTDAEALNLVHDQLMAKLQRQKHRLKGERLETFIEIAGGEPDTVFEHLKNATPAETAAWFAQRPGFAEWLDKKVVSGRPLLIHDGADALVSLTQDFGGQTPEDYLQSFKKFLATHGNELPALLIVTQRPRELTRQQLKELKQALDAEGFGERALAAATATQTNREIAASILGFIRQQALGDPLVPYSERVDRALAKLQGSKPWSRQQRLWLERIGQQLKVEIVVDKEALNRGAFQTGGGFQRIDKLFEGKLTEILGDLHESLWQQSG